MEDEEITMAQFIEEMKDSLDKMSGTDDGESLTRDQWLAKFLEGVTEEEA